MVFLVAVDPAGIAVKRQRWVRNENAVESDYYAYWRDMNDGKTDDRTRFAIHALSSDQHWTNLDRNHVHSDAGYSADRSCDPERCVCESFGLPVKTHPHRVAT